MFRVTILVLAVVSLCSGAYAQTQAQSDRADVVTRRFAALPLCQKLGFQVSEDYRYIGEKLIAELVRGGLARTTAERLAVDSVTRNSKAFEADMSASSTLALTHDALAPFFTRYGQICSAGARDPVVGAYLKEPKNFNLAKAVNDQVDRLLYQGGIASWQTPKIQARGDLMMVAGACRSRIGVTRSDPLVQAYGRSDSPRESAYYKEAFQIGLADPDLGKFTSEQCERAIQRISARAQ